MELLVSNSDATTAKVEFIQMVIIDLDLIDNLDVYIWNYSKPKVIISQVTT